MNNTYLIIKYYNFPNAFFNKELKRKLNKHRQTGGKQQGEKSSGGS